MVSIETLVLDIWRWWKKKKREKKLILSFAIKNAYEVLNFLNAHPYGSPKNTAYGVIMTAYWYLV